MYDDTNDKQIFKNGIVLLGSFAGMAIMTFLFWIAYNNSHPDKTVPFTQPTVCADTEKGFTSLSDCEAQAALIGLAGHCVQRH